MDLFANPNIGTWVVEQVPCTFAKPDKHGGMGTHYSMVLLDKKHNVLYIGSECEHKHGEGIQAIHEMGGGKDTCFVNSALFRHTLSRIRSSEGTTIDARLPQDVEALGRVVPPTLLAVLQSVWAAAAQKHNTRRNLIIGNTAPLMPNKLLALQRVIDRVSANLLGIKPVLSHGKHTDRVHNTSFAKNELVYPRVFRLLPRTFRSTSTFKDDTGILLPEDVNHFITLEFANTAASNFDGTIFAVRDYNERGEFSPGHWSPVSKDVVRRWASRNHTALNERSTSMFALGPTKADHSRCIFCGEEYDRMYRHIKGARHAERVLEVAGLVCKATTTLGLRMLNNPRHRTAFIKDR